MFSRERTVNVIFEVLKCNEDIETTHEVRKSVVYSGLLPNSKTITL